MLSDSTFLQAERYVDDGLAGLQSGRRERHVLFPSENKFSINLIFDPSIHRLAGR